MCDTMGMVSAAGNSIFAKNSDRGPNEPQLIELIPPKKHSQKNLRVTYIEIEQVKETYGLLLSRPDWMWGGEMGINECGVVIGNQAVFTKGKYGKVALLGMDLLRLGLERACTAKEALEIIIGLLEEYGQGGNCGYDKPFEYDNSYLIMDKFDLFVLDTHNKDWAYKRLEKSSISNALNLGTDWDKSSLSAADFTGDFSDPLFTHFSGALKRRASTGANLGRASSVEDMAAALRSHLPDLKNPFAQGSMGSVCMHAGGLVGDHTTQSMIVEFDDQGPPLIWQTGGSTPCISLFKPYLYGNKAIAPVFEEGDGGALKHWLQHEAFARRFLGNLVPAEYYIQLSALEAEFLRQARANRRNKPAMEELALYALAKEEDFKAKWAKKIQPGKLGSLRYRRYWAKKNEQLGKGRPEKLQIKA